MFHSISLYLVKFAGSIQSINMMTVPATDFNSKYCQDGIVYTKEEYEAYISYFYFILKQCLFLGYLWQLCKL